MTIVVADTTCGLPYKLLAGREIPVIPQIVMFGEESYHDDKDFDTAVFLQKLKASPRLPKTAAPEPSLHFPVFEEAQRKRESVVVVAPTGKGEGGRIGGARRLLAELLEIKPILQGQEGQVEPFEQQRTKKKALARLIEAAVEQCQGSDDAHLYVIEVAAEQEAQALVQELKSKIPLTEISIYQLPPAIVVHAGPKRWASAFCRLTGMV